MNILLVSKEMMHMCWNNINVRLTLISKGWLYSFENWQIVVPWNSCRAQYCGCKSQEQLIKHPAHFGIIFTFLLCLISLLVEGLLTMRFFFSSLVKDSSCVFDRSLLKFKQGVLLGISLYLYPSKDYKGQATLIQRVNLSFMIRFRLI